MSTVQDIAAAVEKLSDADLAEFRAWFAAFNAAAEWDRQFEDDVAAGRLDWLVAEARAENRACPPEPRP